jgi:hypothetical protein
MAEALRSSEPRLVSMFAIFTRLFENETRPRLEQLPATRAWLKWPTLVTRRIPGGQTEDGRRRWRRMLVLTHVALAVILLLALHGNYLNRIPACGIHSRAALVAASARPSCPLSGADLPTK